MPPARGEVDQLLKRTISLALWLTRRRKLLLHAILLGRGCGRIRVRVGGLRLRECGDGEGEQDDGEFPRS